MHRKSVRLIYFIMVKTTFLERFEKANKFFDNVYHHHKATYKGMAQFFQNYSEIQKNYANSILYQSQTSESFIPDLKKQQPSVIQGVKEICSHLQKISQLHFNFGERLSEMAMTYQDSYLSSKKKKERFMKEKIEKNEEAHDKAKATKDRSKVQNKEKQICKALFEGLDEYMQDQVSRNQNLKQQMIIYFSLVKKIAERKIELSSGNNLKMSQFNSYVKVNNLSEIQEQIVDQYNGYGDDKLVRKNRDLKEELANHLEMMRSSINHRDKASRMEQNMNKLEQIISRYQNIPQQLNYPHEDDYLIGIFDKRVIPNYKQYSRQFKSQALKQIAFAWLTSHYSSEHDEEAQSLLTVAKVNLKVRQIKLSKTKDIKDFIHHFMQQADQNHKKTFSFLIQISQVYEGTLRMVELQKALASNQLTKSVSNTIQHPIHWKISLVFVDSLLDSVIINEQDYSVLYDEYVQILQLIVRFAKMTFDLPATIVISLFLRKLKRVLEVTMSTERERLQQLLTAKFDLNDEFSQTEELKMHICHRLIFFLTTKMTTFYKNLIDFSNLVKLSLAVEKVLPKNYLTTMEHLHSCIKIAGYNFFHDHDEDNRVTQGLWTGEERLKNLTFALQDLQIDKVNKDYIEPMAKELSKLLGVGYPVVASRMKKQFMTPIFEIIQCSLELLNQTSGVDKQGYVLKLGIKLALLDVQQPQPLSNYIVFFKVLENYLSSTEKDYDQLLEYARKTELWIVEQNSQATQNCIDFCSLLYKPFEFLLISLKKLQEEHEQTEFITRYSDFIKYKLNSALKGQIEKYVAFLDQSLNTYHKSQPALALKYKRLPEPFPLEEENQNKERFSFKDITRRLFNLIFLKDQLDELVCDFVDKQIYQELNRSIFHLSELQKAAQDHPGHQKILLNIHGIATLISQTEKDLISKIAHITVFHFMRKIFANLYYQQEKGFFASDSDYKLSEYTFQKHQTQLEEIMLTISRNIPHEIIDEYSKQFCRCLYLAYRCEVLDANKFKIPIKKQKVIGYLQTDLNFFCNLAKHKFMSPQCVKQHFEDPCHRLLGDIESSSSKLMESFSEANVKNDSQNIRYYLLLLNLRKEEKAEQFVQKYKKFMK